MAANKETRLSSSAHGGVLMSGLLGNCLQILPVSCGQLVWWAPVPGHGDPWCVRLFPVLVVGAVIGRPGVWAGR